MKVYRYVHFEQGTATDTKGQNYLLRGWGGSNRGVDEAAEDARRRLDEITAAVRLRAGSLSPSDEYQYGSGVLREEWLMLVSGSDDDPEAVVTRNRYGSPVLNTRRMAIVDIDFNDARGCGELLSFWKPAPDPEAIALERVARWAEANPQASLRLYRTPSGLRVVRTDQVADPTSEDTAVMFEALGADRLYRALCRRQACFRARLGVKPWRVDLPLPPSDFPRRDEAQAAFDAWLRAYEAKSQGFAACRHVRDFGAGLVCDDLRAEVEAHDVLAQTMSGRPIA